jgi:hypothetical protein
MPPANSVPEFETRRTFYKIDNRVCSILAAVWPIIAPTINRSIEEVIDGVLELPIGVRVAPHRESITKLELAHFQALLGGDLDRRYAESCRRTVEREAEIGLDARIRSSAGNTVLRGALDALARAHRFSPAKLAERAKVVSQVISFDVANAMTLHRQAAERAAHSRRDAIDAAIAEFDGAIGEVIEAIKEASASLTLTGSMLRQIAEDTLNRMASASSASAETARRMDATVTATEELSGSIQEIGQQATNGLGMAQSAVADTERTQTVIGTLNDAAERIGSVVGTISAIAVQTNLLALKCHDRGGACRGSRQRICGGRRRGQNACQSDLARHRRHLAAGCRHSGCDQTVSGGNLRDRAHHRQIDDGLDQYRHGRAAAEHDHAQHRRKHSQCGWPYGARVRRDQLGGRGCQPRRRRRRRDHQLDRSSVGTRQ